MTHSTGSSKIITRLTLTAWGEILLNTSDLALQMSAEDRKNWNNQAQEILDEQTPRIALGADTMTIEYEKIKGNMSLVHHKLGVEAYLEQAAKSCRLKGQPVHKLRQFLEGFVDAETVIDLLRSGQRSFTVADFKPNGGRQVRQSASYGKAQELCHHAIAKLYEKGRVALLPWEDLKG